MVAAGLSLAVPTWDPDTSHYRNMARNIKEDVQDKRNIHCVYDTLFSQSVKTCRIVYESGACEGESKGK